MAERSKAPEIPDDLPEYYVDSVHITTQLYSSTLYMGQMKPDGSSTFKLAVKMSPPMAKVVSLILAKHVRNYESDVGEIKIPKELLHNLGLEEML